MTFNFIWPIALVVLSNTIYHICSKVLPQDVDPMVSLFVTYITAAAVTAAIYFFSRSGYRGIMEEFSYIKWPSIALGLAVVGLEFGFIMAYRAGWNISVGTLVANICLAVILLAIGVLLFKENVSIKQIAGAALCVAGLVLIQV
jgi:drug/metabolite transporter (DMT)-like permease